MRVLRIFYPQYLDECRPETPSVGGYLEFVEQQMKHASQPTKVISRTKRATKH